MKIRKPDNEDLQRKAAAVLHRAFPNSKYEERLIQNLHAKKRTVYEWVAIHRNLVVGYVAFTYAYNGDDVVGLHLAPLAVHPDFQKTGIGTELMLFALRQKEIKDQNIFVLGKPGYYERFDFKHVAQPVCPFTKNNKNFMLRGSMSDCEFSLGYEKEFSTTK